MKSYSLIILLIGALFIVSCQDKGNKTAAFKVWGNCEMCKSTVEGSLSNQPGIKSAVWDVKSKIMTVAYDSTATNVNEIHKKIAAVGYDTENEKGDDNAYSQLHECCKYKRKE